MLPITTAMNLREPQRSDALELLVEEHTQVAVQVVAPKGSKRRHLNVSLTRDRHGDYRRRDIPVDQPTILPVATAIRLLHKYGEGARLTMVDAEGVGIPPAKRAYLVEVALPENDGLQIATGYRGEGASTHGVILIHANEAPTEDEAHDFADVDLFGGEDDAPPPPAPEE